MGWGGGVFGDDVFSSLLSVSFALGVREYKGIGFWNSNSRG